MVITNDIVKGLLEKLISPSYPELIDDYMVEVSNFNDGSTGIVIGVIVHPEVYYKMDTYTGNPLSGIDRKITKEIKGVLKYLGPNVSDVSLYVVDNE